jgi:CheY-like chemotaxis protein
MAGGHAHTVLVVDDNPDEREATAMLLELNGTDVRLAQDGQEALDALHAGLRPCLILLDVNMPRMDGVAFWRAQQAEPALRDIPVAVLSALPRLHARDVLRSALRMSPYDDDDFTIRTAQFCTY